MLGEAIGDGLMPKRAPAVPRIETPVTPTHTPRSSRMSIQAPKGPAWLAAEVGALGVVFGDIGTSPLYAFKTALGALGTSQPSVADVLGLLSLVVWALTLSVTLEIRQRRLARRQ